LIGPLSAKEYLYCSDASITRYLSSRNWNANKAAQMLKQSLKWRKEFKPEEIRWVGYYLCSLFNEFYESSF